VPIADPAPACVAQNCPDTSWSTDPDDFDGMGISFPTFVAPPTGNSQRWINELGYVLDVIGYSTGTCVSTAAGDAVGDTDFDACAAVTALADDTACVAIMTAATDDAADAAACTYTPTFAHGEYTYKDGVGTCAETATTSVPADTAACAAVTALGDATACEAVSKDGVTASAGSAATCVEAAATSVDADAEACACVTDLTSATACEAVMTAATDDNDLKACTYSPSVPPVDDQACTYTPPQEKTKTATDSTTAIAHMTCMCNNCAGAVEAIFQPVGRSVCEVLGADMPCKTELAACEASAAGALATSGSTATFDTVFTPVGGPGSASVMAPSTVSQCSPAAAFGAYKVDWKLDEFAAEAADGTCTKEGAAETPAVCTAADAAADAVTASACAAATDEAACGDIGMTHVGTCTETAETSVAADADLCAAVTGTDLDDATACEAVKTTATETCAVDGAAAGAAVDPSACTYTPALPRETTCTWNPLIPAGADTVLAAEVVTYQKCIAASRAAAFDPDFNCLVDVGAATCDGDYVCTYVAPVAEDTPDKASGASAAAASAGVLAAVALLF
jgi:hypothetical protein